MNKPSNKFDEFIENYRQKQITRLHNMNSFRDCWAVWEPQIREITSDFTEPEAIYNLGHHLSDIFRSTGKGNRDQASLSGGGAAWEALVCWYLNQVFVGTPAIAFKQNRGLIPDCIFDAATVTYGNHQTNTESDISVIVLPNGLQLPKGIVDDKAIYEHLVREHFSKVSLGIIQCKTNWNDNAQIPMLWDMVYKANYDKNSGVKIGRSGYSIKHLNFSYSFVVVPSQKGEIKPGSTPTIRVQSLTGGNYWGQPTKSGVALSLAEIFTHNFGSAFSSNVQETIAQAIKDHTGPYCK